jgi:16S rRNA (adenine1518-N6/adenine1519-N6)-dimethyltransferase
VVVTVQKEVAERLVASPKTSDYGAITASIGAIANSKIIKYIDRQMFMPAPNVDSSVIRLTIHNKPPIDVLDEREFFKFVKAAFSQRRKTLINSVLSAGYNKENVKEALDSLEIDQNVRAEKLDMKGLAAIFNHCYQSK